jgi:hypothetical protein
MAVVADESKYLWTDTTPAERNWLAQKRNLYEGDGDMVLASVFCQRIINHRRLNWIDDPPNSRR